MDELPGFPSESVDVVDGLVRLYQWAGRPGLRRLRALGGTVTTTDGEVVEALPISTVSDVLNGKRRNRVPRREFVDAFVAACLKARGTGPEDVAVVLASWQHACRTSSETAHPAPADQLIAVLDPSEARTSAEFVERLRSLKDASNLTYRQLVAKAEANGEVLPLATLASALTRATLPRAALVSAFTRACGCGPEEVSRWLAARHRLATARHDVAPPQVDRPPRELPGHGAGGHSSTRDDRGHGRQTRTGAVLLVCLLLAVLTAAHPSSRSSSSALPGRPRVDQASTPCPATLRLGATGACVEEVQSWLVRAGLRMPVDGVYGPYTKMKVVVFQLYAGISGTGVVDERTLRSLRADRTKIETWSTDRVERRLREVFPEEPDRVVALVRCLSNLDPLWVFGQADWSRTWGLFQLTDREVVLDHDGSYLAALDPEWNIQTAREIRDRTGGLARWTCGPA